MMSNLHQLLNQGIAHLRGGGTVEEYVRQMKADGLSDAEREELRGLLDTAADLPSLLTAILPAPRAKAVNRARFLGEVAQWREKPRPRGLVLPAPARLWRALAGLGVALVLLLTIVGGAARAAAASLPSSPLYPLKLALEDTRLILTFNPAMRAQLYLDLAEQRTMEIIRLASAERPANEAVVRRMAQELQGAVLTAQAVGGQPGHALLEQVIASTHAQEEELRQASATAAPQARAMLDAAVAVAQEASRQAQQALEPSPTPAVPTSTPSALPTPTWTSTPTPVPSQPPVILPQDTATPTSSASPSATASPTHTPPPTLSATPLHTPGVTVTPKPISATWTPSATPSYTPHPTQTPSATPTETHTLAPTGTPSFTPTHTLSPTPSLTPTYTPSPTHTPRVAFRLTLVGSPNPVPATYRIHYSLTLINEGEVPLTNVFIVDTWSPTECLYLPPDNPSALTWAVGTVNPHDYWAVEFVLWTYSICAGRTARNEAVMTCDQGVTRAIEFTRIVGTPTPTATATLTQTATPAWTLTPLSTATPTRTLTPTPTSTD